LTNQNNQKQNQIIFLVQQRTEYQERINNLTARLNQARQTEQERNDYLAELNQQINELQQQLANGQAAQTVSENERDNYLNELNDLDKDFCEQENILADKNAKLAEAIKEKNDLQAQLTNERNLNQTLQEQINDHRCPTPAPHICPPCSLTHLSEPHICPIINQIDCSHEDY